MKILWVTNSIMPDLAVGMGEKPGVFGGWQFGLAKDLAASGISLTVVTARPNKDEFYISKNNIDYFLIKSQKSISKYDSTLEKKWKDIIKKVNPDLVHIHGTEHAHGLSLIKACPELKYVISIQGLISVYERYFKGGITFWEIIKSVTLRDLIKQETIWQLQNSFKNRGDKVETEYFSIVNNVIGRTEWDKHHSSVMNPNSNYHFCNESLRDSFYQEKKWNINKKENFSIFISQSGYPIKGMHQVLKAVNLIKKDFPSVKIKFAGGNILERESSIKEKLKLKGYGRFLNKLIKKYGLQNNIEYLGVLSEIEMRNQYLNSHVFVCPSSIENSPNSLGESQILGVPCISSYVGGTPDMIQHHKTGFLYRFEEVEMLAQYLKHIFLNDDMASEISTNGIEVATSRHDRKTNCVNLKNIYNKIIELNI
tara:strand:- start:10257 stop:11528 length:1272 start_codon:yes stop_codon:yes gene_type:complete